MEHTKPKTKVRFSQQQIKHNNKMLLFALIRKHQSISRIQLAKQTGLSATAVSLLVEELIEEGFVKEGGVAKTNIPGRRPIMLEVNPQGGYFVVLELLSGGFICSLYDLCSKRIALEKYKQKDDASRKITLLEAVEKITANAGEDEERLLGVCVLYPGVVDEKNKKMLCSTALDISAYTDQTEVDKLSERYGARRTFVTNTTTAAAYSDFRQNRMIANACLIEIAMDEGIGGCLIDVDQNGNFSRSYLMEVGHVVVQRGGEPCKCGNFGCFEALCSPQSIIRRVNREACLSLPYDDDYGADVNRLSLQRILQMEEEGNQAIISVIADVRDMIKTVIINTINITDAEYVFLSGILTALLKESDVEGIRADVMRLLSGIGRRNCKILISHMDFEKKRQGAVGLMTDAAFRVRL